MWRYHFIVHGYEAIVSRKMACWHYNNIHRNFGSGCEISQLALSTNGVLRCCYIVCYAHLSGFLPQLEASTHIVIIHFGRFFSTSMHSINPLSLHLTAVLMRAYVYICVYMCVYVLKQNHFKDLMQYTWKMKAKPNLKRMLSQI